LAAARDGDGVPIPPRWLSDQGGRITGVFTAEPKVRHGRREVRVLWAARHPGVLRWLGSTGIHRSPWPHVRQFCRVERHRIPLQRGVPTGPASVEVTYYITSLPPERADAARLLTLIRGHWGIENRVHYVRDVTFDEDRSAVRSGAAPQVMAAARNLVLALLRRQHHANVAAALRTYASRPRSAIHLVANAHRFMVK
jgi:Transposase DDE domain